MPEKKLKPNVIEVWGANVHDLLDIEGVTVKLSRWKGCDDACAETDHDPIAKVYRVKFPDGTCSNKVKENIMDYTLPKGHTVRVVRGGNFYDKLIVFRVGKKKAATT
jgi:hypothetical protein